MGSDSIRTCIYSYYYILLCMLLIFACGAPSCYGYRTFGFDVHHRFSDSVKGLLPVDELPEKGSLEYYAALAKRDSIIRGRNLAAASDQTPVTFLDGNQTYLLNSLGHLHYANISVGTPSVSFIVALDTGSDLFWLPCDCTSCLHGLRTSMGEEFNLNIYSPSSSATSSQVPCNSNMCNQKRQCSSAEDVCPYQVRYLSNGTSSTGILVEDVLHLTTDSNHSKAVDARIIFGCGKVQTGSFLDAAAPNGLFGLGMDNFSIPSILAREGIVSNSFSMCFGPDGIGRISFGDKGFSHQGETPFNLRQLHSLYNISITQINVEGNVRYLDINAIFDSGTSFTYLSDPAYTFISESFNSLTQEKRHSSDSEIPFEYCYDLSQNQTGFSIPNINLTMKGGNTFPVTNPVVVIPFQDGFIYCLGIAKSQDINIIGQNFMTGYEIAFDREKMVLGWKASDCYNYESNTVPINPWNIPAVAVNPEATAGSDNDSKNSGTPPRSKHLLLLNYFAALTMVLLILHSID